MITKSAFPLLVTMNSVSFFVPFLIVPKSCSVLLNFATGVPSLLAATEVSVCPSGLALLTGASEVTSLCETVFSELIFEDASSPFLQETNATDAIANAKTIFSF